VPKLSSTFYPSLMSECLKGYILFDVWKQVYLLGRVHVTFLISCWGKKWSWKRRGCWERSRIVFVFTSVTKTSQDNFWNLSATVNHIPVFAFDVLQFKGLSWLWDSASRLKPFPFLFNSYWTKILVKHKLSHLSLIFVVPCIMLL